jgi:DNA-binding CsgD family transcriptional regulator
MLLNMDPFNPANQHFNVPLASLGGVINSVGTPDFAQRLTEFLNGIIPLDAAHVERARASSDMPTGYQCEWIGTGGIDVEPGMLSDVMELYYDRFHSIDPLYARIRGVTGTQLIIRDVSALPSGEFRQRIFDAGRVTHECVLAKGTRHTQYSLALTRTEHLPQFSLAELNRLRNIGEFVFPLFELHASTTAARRVAHSAIGTNPLAMFDARMVAEGVRLSRREYESCKHLISGKTVPETAAILGVRVGSAESYVERAFTKLGVRTKKELVAWGAQQTGLSLTPFAGPTGDRETE